MDTPTLLGLIIHLSDLIRSKTVTSIRRMGLLPGGARGGHNHVHFALDHCLTTMANALRPESDCVIIVRPSSLHGLDPLSHKTNMFSHLIRLKFNRVSGVYFFC